MKINLISHRMNLGDVNNSLNNQVDNSYEALRSLTTQDINLISGFECDLRLTKDKVLVVVHDESTKTLTKDKKNYKISELNYEELEKIVVKDILWYYKGMILRSYLFPDSKKIRKVLKDKLKKDTIIPKAYDMFNYLVEINYQGQIILELKEDSDDCKKEMIKLINKYKDKLNILVHGYFYDKVLDIKNKTGVKTGCLYNGIGHRTIKFNTDYINKNDYDFYSLMWEALNKKNLTAIINNKKDLYLWTIDSIVHYKLTLFILKKYYKKYHKLPKNIYFITNIPLILKEYLKKDKIAI